MKVTITFNLPEDQYQHKVFNQAMEYANVVLLSTVRRKRNHSGKFVK